MYNDSIKKNCRTIHTGLKGKKNYEIICSVEGQLSDGMWEESFVMRGYWLFSCVGMEDDEVVIYISKQWADIDFGNYRANKFVNMSDEKIKQWFANKIKQIIKQEQSDWPNENNVWDRKCLHVTKYMGYDEDITVQDCYRAYDSLKNRGNILWFGKDN